MFDIKTVHAVTTLAQNAHIDPAALLAVAEVESGGHALFNVNDKMEPAIRFEGHYFDRRLSGRIREHARKLGIASPQVGKVLNPKMQRDRWELLMRAAAINRKAALESTSWGLGQVMGAHWEWLGYHSVEELVNDARQSVSGQIALMLNFIDKAGLTQTLQERDWESFAKRYNGPAFARNRYDQRMAAAWARWNQVQLEA